MLRVTVLIALVSSSLCVFDPELHAKYLSMPHDEFVEYFNKQNYGFKIGSSPKVDKSHTSCAMVDLKSYNKLLRIYHGSEAVTAAPENFDARQQWPNCQTISEIYTQGQCGACWTFGAASVASDRTCIHAGVNVRLSEQDFECLKPDVCNGGAASNAFQFWKTDGLVTQDCKPYDINKLLNNPGCTMKCVNGADYNGDKHYGGTVYAVPNDNNQIMAELSQNGPIEATFNAYEDFRKYTSGIYEHMYGDRLSYHSVRIIGYGEEDSVPFWLVANSYGTDWGEYGTIRIKRFAADLEFENLLIAGKPRA